MTSPLHSFVPLLPQSCYANHHSSSNLLRQPLPHEPPKIEPTVNIVPSAIQENYSLSNSLSLDLGLDWVWNSFQYSNFFAICLCLRLFQLGSNQKKFVLLPIWRNFRFCSDFIPDLGLARLVMKLFVEFTIVVISLCVRGCHLGSNLKKFVLFIPISMNGGFCSDFLRDLWSILMLISDRIREREFKIVFCGS